MSDTATPSQGRIGDRVVAGVLALAYLAALAIGAEYHEMPLAAVGGGLLLALGLGAWRWAPGSLLSRMVLSAALMSMVALHIQLGRGTVDFHFGVFVSLGILLVYLDWRPIALAAGLIAFHHLLFDRLQAMGWPVYCVTEPSFLRVAMHAGYVVAQTGFEISVAVWMSRVTSAARDSSSRLAQAMQQLQLTLQTTRETAVAIEAASSEIVGGNSNLSQRTVQAAGQLQRAAVSMTQLTEAVQESAVSAGSANRLAVAAAAAAERGGRVVSEVVSKMEDISNSSRKIADITGVIDSIAFQTNILALNAAVEAARAGEQGRGFAVVASEVRSLAQRSAEAAQQIKVLIGASVETVESGSRLVNDAGGTMNEIVDGVRQVAGIIDQMSRSAASQSHDIVSVKDTVSELDQMTAQNAALVEQSAGAADRLRQQALRLSEVMRSLRFA